MDKMNFNRKVFALLMLTIMAISCSNKTAEGSIADRASMKGDNTETLGQITISGKIEGGAGQQLILQQLKLRDAVYLDTITIEKSGHFRFDFTPSAKGFFRVMLNEQNMFVFVVSQNEDIEVDANAENLYATYKVKKGVETQRLFELNQILGKRDSVSMQMQTAQMNRDQNMFDAVMQVYDKILLEVDRDIKNFIDQKTASFSSLAALQNLNPDTDFDYYEKVISSLDGIANGNEYYDALSAEVKAMKALATGSVAPEISLPQPNGEILSLSDLKGKYVLIDFWASWCGPCRRENPNVKRVYEKYHNRGFEILGVSLDKAQGAWVSAIEQDGLTWKHVSDLKYWQSEVVPLYQIQGIPLTVLVDKDGKIIAKNLRGQALEEKLAQIFGN